VAATASHGLGHVLGAEVEDGLESVVTPALCRLPDYAAQDWVPRVGKDPR
jgi:hypothetical protein